MAWLSCPSTAARASSQVALRSSPSFRLRLPAASCRSAAARKGAAYGSFWAPRSRAARTESSAAEICPGDGRVYTLGLAHPIAQSSASPPPQTTHLLPTYDMTTSLWVPMGGSEAPALAEGGGDHACGCVTRRYWMMGKQQPLPQVVPMGQAMPAPQVA
jgi:hypothetical protein